MGGIVRYPNVPYNIYIIWNKIADNFSTHATLYKPYTYHLFERMVERVTEGKKRRQISTFSARLAKLFGFVKFQMTIEDSKGAYAIQPSTDSLKAYRGSPVIDTSH